MAAQAPPATDTVHYISEEYTVRPHWVRRIVSFFKVNPDLVIDGFSTESNKRFKLNITEKDNSLAAAWPSGYTMWLNPPWTLFPSVVEKIFKDNVACIVIFPAWDSKVWVKQLLDKAQKLMYFEAGSRIFELAGRPQGGIRWGLYAIYIDASTVGQQVNSVEITPWSWSKASRRRWRRKQHYSSASVWPQAPAQLSFAH